MWFWLAWEPQSKRAYILSLILFVITSALFGYYVLYGQALHYQWEIVAESEKIPIVIDQVVRGIFTFDIETGAAITTQQFAGTPFNLMLTSAGITYFTVVFSFLLILVTSSFLNNWLFFLCSFGSFAFFIFEQPMVLFNEFAYDALIKVAPVVFFGLPSYYFFAINTKVGFLCRLLILGGIYIVYYCGLGYLSGSLTNASFLLLNYSIPVLLIVSILFIVFIAYEILYAFLGLIQSSKAGDGKGTANFVLVSVIYLGNLILHYLQLSRQIQWGVWFISPFVIVWLSAVLGIWGTKERNVLYQKWLPFYPFGAVIYIAWATICFATMGFCFSSANDPLIEVFEDAILFTHIGFGLGLFMYVIVLYKDWIDKALPVSKIMYQTPRATLLTVWGAGIVVCMSLFFYANMFPYYQSFAGYYAGLGDAYYSRNEPVLAEEYYKQSIKIEFQNHKANYALAIIYQTNGLWYEALKHYKQATLKQPTPYAYANAALLDFKLNKQLEGVLLLKDGIQNFPKNAQLYTNCAIAFQQMNFLDSALIYLNKAERLFSNPVVPEANKLALFAKLRIPTPYQSSISTNTNIVLQTNRLAFELTQVQKENLKDVVEPNFKDTVMNTERLNYITNYTLYNLQHLDSSYVAQLNSIANKDTNVAFRSDLYFLKAVSNYYNGNVLDALKAVDELQLGSDYDAGNYLKMIGLWTLKNNVSRFAADIFQLAADKGNTESLFLKSVSACEYGNYHEAVSIWNRKEVLDDPLMQVGIQKIQTIFSIQNPNMLLVSSDLLKYAYLYYKKESLSDEILGNTFYSFASDTLKMQAGLLLFDHYFSKGQFTRCAEIIQELQPIAKPTFLEEPYEWAIIQYLEATENSSELEIALSKTSIKHTGKLAYAQARLLHLNDKYSEAAPLYKKAAAALPFNERVVLQASSFYQNKLTNSEVSFNMLLNAVSLNKYNPRLYKAYCLQAIAYGIPSFADNGLKQLQYLLSKSDYETFVKTLDQAKKSSFNF